MFLDIFSSFDDHNRVFMNLTTLMWLAIPYSLINANKYMFVQAMSSNFITHSLLQVSRNLVMNTSSRHHGGASTMFSVLFMLIVFFNLTGLLPMMFSVTSHLATNLALSLPLWFSIVMSGILFDLPAWASHLQPTGSPALLNPFLCVVELVSMLVRPLTLAVRLTANMSTGHILMGLLGSKISVPFLVIGSLYYMFEIGVCAVQAYIFTLLPTLYLDEHPN